MERPIEQLNADFEAFLAKEKGQAPSETPMTTEVEHLAPRKTSDRTLGSDIVETRHFERGAEKSIIREKNFGKIDPRKYGAAFDASLQRVSKIHEKQITKADEKVYYNEVLWDAVKESQLPSKNKNVSEGFMLITLANRLKRKFEKDYKEPSDHFGLDVSAYSAVGSDLEKDKGVVAIVECRTSDSLITNKFFVTTKGYKRDIRHDIPEPGYLNKDFQNLGTPAISLPIPFDGFEEDDLMTVKKDNLPNKICDDAAGKMLSTLKRSEVFA